MRKVILFITIIMIAVSVSAQYDSLWSKTYGGGDYDKLNDMCKTYDSHYLLCGMTYSFGAGTYDYWLVKTDTDFDTLWTKTYGRSDYEECTSVIETSDSNYLLGGMTDSYGAGLDDIWLIKTDENGDTLWTRIYGGSGYDECASIIETSDSCYLLGGYTESYGSGNGDVWVLKTDENGDTLWTKTYGGNDVDSCSSVIETRSGYYLFAGYTEPSGPGNKDIWLIKTDENGSKLWTKTYGGAQDDKCFSVIETSDLGYLMVGSTESSGEGMTDFWAIKTDENGDTLWTKTYGDIYWDECRSVIETSDSCYLLGGGRFRAVTLSWDYCVIKTDVNGNTLWTRIYGGDGGENCKSLIETDPGDYLLGGFTTTYGAGDVDFYLIKMANVTLDNFSITPTTFDFTSDSILLNWHPSECRVSFEYEIMAGNVIDTVPQSDTMVILDNLSEGEYPWSVAAINGFGYRTVSNNVDTFWVDQTPPAALAVEEIQDANYSGPYELRVMAEDTMAGIDSIVIRYVLPGDTMWDYAGMNNETWLWYSGYIPEASQTGYAYYYLELYDRAVPANFSREPAYPDLYSFEITGLTGIDKVANIQYSLHIKQISNTSVMLTLPKGSPVNISVYDISGRNVVNRAMNLPAGSNRINLDIIPGVYFIQINTPYDNYSGKLVNIQ